MENYYFDEHGIYTGSAPAHENSFPPENALRIAPTLRDGSWPVLNAARDGWDLAEDHRETRGWLNGQPAIMDVLGPLPEGWSDCPPEEEPVPYDQERERAYAAEADPLREKALSYQLEAQAWKADGNAAMAKKALGKYRREMAAYLAVKEAIRLRYPNDQEPAQPDDNRLFLSPSGVYHNMHCGFAKGDVARLAPDEIVAQGDAVRPCRRCRPEIDVEK